MNLFSKIVSLLSFVVDKWDGASGYLKGVFRGLYEKKVDEAVDSNDGKRVDNIVRIVKKKREKRRDRS
jgi:hypothetical protein